MMSNSHLVLGPQPHEVPRRGGGGPTFRCTWAESCRRKTWEALAKAGISKCFTTGRVDRHCQRGARGDQAARRSGGSGTAQLARDIPLAHDSKPVRQKAVRHRPRVIGVTGSPGRAANRRWSRSFVGEFTPGRAGDARCRGRCGVVAFDPMSPITSGALGDRLRVDFNSPRRECLLQKPGDQRRGTTTLSRR